MELPQKLFAKPWDQAIDALCRILTFGAPRNKMFEVQNVHLITNWNWPEECGDLAVGGGVVDAPLGIRFIYEDLDVLLRLIDDGGVVAELEHAQGGREYGQDEDHGVALFAVRES